jgi:CARDB
VLIRDNESVPTATLIVTDSQATEHADTGAFGVKLSRAAGSDITVYYSITGSATNDTDYVRIDNFVTIPAGLNFGQIVINPYEEFVAENPETVKLTLGLGPGYNPGKRTTGTVTIFDPASDPVLTDLTSPQTLTTGTGATLPVSVAIFNRGRTPTGEFVVSIYLTSLQNPGSDGYVEYFLGDISYNDGLFPGFEARGTLTTPVVNQPPAGLYRVKIVIDPDNEVTELREDNNTIRSTLLVRVD